MTNMLTGRQGALICSIMIFSSKLLVLPSLFYSSNHTLGIFSLLIIFLLEFIFLLFLIKIKKNNSKINFFNLFSNKIGKIFTKIILIFLFLFFAIKAIYILEESFNFLKRSLYTEATIFVYLVCVLPVISAFAYKKLKAFGRTLEIFYLVIISLILFCTFVWILSVENFSFTILSGFGINEFFNTTFKYSFWFGDFVFFMFILDKVNFDKNSPKQLIGYSLLSFIIVTLFIIVFFITFQTTSFVHTYAILDIVQFVNDFGTIGKFDIIPITSIMFLIFFQIGIFTYCAKDCLEKIFPFKHQAQPLILINLIYIASCYFIFNNENNFIIFSSEYIKYFSLFVVYIIPLLFVAFSFLPKKNKEVKK